MSTSEHEADIELERFYKHCRDKEVCEEKLNKFKKKFIKYTSRELLIKLKMSLYNLKNETSNTRMTDQTKHVSDEDIKELKNIIIQRAENELSEIMDEWCKSNANNCTGGKMRGQRGSDIEKFVVNTINKIGELLKINLIAKCGNDDKKKLIITLPDGKKLTKDHQVDVHIYLNGVFVSVIECKAYLDSCYYVRTCDDFKMFKKFDYNVKNYIFTLENGIGEDTKIFTDYINENICDDIFYLLDGKRTSSKPVYDMNHKKTINKNVLTKFIDSIFILGTI